MRCVSGLVSGLLGGHIAAVTVAPKRITRDLLLLTVVNNVANTVIKCTKIALTLPVTTVKKRHMRSQSKMMDACSTASQCL